MILKFPTAAARGDFLQRVEAEAPDLSWRMKPSFAQSKVVLVRRNESLSEAKLLSLLCPYLDPSVEVFEDVQFGVMGQPAAVRF